MKQDLPPAKSQTSLIAIVMLALAVLTVACARQARLVSSEVKLNVEAPGAQPGSVININTASTLELEQLPGVGKAVAERIVAHREQYGHFRRAEHLMMVRGISDRKFREMRSRIVVE